MGEIALGLTIVPAAGTPVRATTNIGSVIAGRVPADRLPCHAYLIQTWTNNKGRAYVGAEGMNGAAGAYTKAVLAIPTANSIPSFSATLTDCPNGLNLADVWLDVDNDGEGMLVTPLVY